MNLPGYEKKMSLDYHFSVQEIAILARFFRKHQNELPDGLKFFAGAVEKTVYNSMSIDEAERFYS